MVVTRSSSNPIMLDQDTKDYIASLIAPLSTAAQCDEILSQLREQAERIVILEDQVKLKEARITHLETKLDDLEQYTRRYSVRINGVPVPKPTEDDNVMEIVENCCTEMGANFDKNAIDRAHRVGPVQTDTRSHKKFQSVIVKFTHWDARCQFYKKRPRFSAEGARKPSFKVALDLTRRRYRLMTSSIEKVKSYPDVDFVCADINCGLKLRGLGKFHFFNTESELDGILKDFKQV